VYPRAHGSQTGRGDHHVVGVRIFSPPRCSQEHKAVRSPSENCARIKQRGYIAGRHMNLLANTWSWFQIPFWRATA
jgi:hypothetical protein